MQIGIIVLTAAGVILAVAIGVVNRYFGVKTNPLVDKLMELMPGANCGACGFAGCADYVEAMVNGKAEPGKCFSVTPEAVKEASKLLGREIVQDTPLQAIVACSGDDVHTVHIHHYNGITDCRNASQVAGGGKECLYGCLGLGSCARVCPFGAIEITARHLAVVHPELCAGCGKCVSVCPRHLIRLVPRSSKIQVYCSSPVPLKQKRSYCSGACMGCGKCKRNAQEGQIEMVGSLAKVNDANPPDPELAKQCPVRVLRSWEQQKG